MDPVTDDMPILNRDVIDGIVAGSVDVALFEIDILALVDLQCLVRDRSRLPLTRPETAVQLETTHQDEAALLEMERVSGRNWPDRQVDQVEVSTVKDVQIALQHCAPTPIGTLEDDREGRRTVTSLEIVRDARFRIVTGGQHDPPP